MYLTMYRKIHLFSFALFLIVSWIPFIGKLDSSRYLTISVISSISSFENIRLVYGPKMFFWITLSVSDAPTVNFKDTRTVLPNSVNIFCNNGKATFNNGARKVSNPS